MNKQEYIIEQVFSPTLVKDFNQINWKESKHFEDVREGE